MSTEIWIPDTNDFPYETNIEDFVEAIMLEIMDTYRVHFNTEIRYNKTFLSDFVYEEFDWVLGHVKKLHNNIKKVTAFDMTQLVASILLVVFRHDKFKEKEIKINNPLPTIKRLLKNYKETRSEEVVPESPPRGKPVRRIMPEHESDIRDKKRTRMMVTINGWYFGVI